MTVAAGTYVSTSTLKPYLGGTAAIGTADDTLLATICEQVNASLEQMMGRAITPIGSGTVTYDIHEATNVLYVKEGIRAITSLEVADYTGASYTTVGTADYFLRPQYPKQGWPYTEVWLSDVATTYSTFPAGFNTVRIVCTRGWAETPEDLEDVAIRMAVRAWHGRAAGNADQVGVDDMGQPIVSRGLSKKDRETVARYTIPPTAV